MPERRGAQAGRSQTLFRCEQCTYQEWRSDDDEGVRCPACGNERWEPVQTKNGPTRKGAPDDDGRP